jgi:hypothetical protein
LQKRFGGIVVNYAIEFLKSITADVAKNVFEVPNLGYSVVTECKSTFLQIKFVLQQM